ncbi:MAG TPA: SRPBCC family protein [Burkholderiaceae bacterium]|nr:SRPBCC family protein [Burkholderiaceae bacterium]
MLNRIVAIAALAAGGILLSKQLKKSRGSGMRSSTEESIEVDVPVSTAYNQWTQFEDFPKFMESVREVQQLDDTHLRWRAEIGGKEEQWDAEITEQIPDKRIAWRSIGGVKNAGAVTFHKISDSKTRIMLQMDYEPRNVSEGIGDAFGVVKMQLKGNLKRFKELLESRGKETGAWRGSVAQH